MTKNKKIANTDLARFCRQWALLSQTAVPIDKSLLLLATGMKSNKPFANIMMRIHHQIKGGASLKNAFTYFQNRFPKVFLSAIFAGEKAGNLAASLQKTANYLEGIEKLKKEVTNTMIYPLFTLGTALIVVLFMLIFIVPSFADIYTMTGSKIPLFTASLIRLGNFISNNMIGLAALMVILIFLLSTLNWQNLLLRMGLALPGIRRIIHYAYRGNFSFTMWILLSNGIPLVQALETCQFISNLSLFRKEVAFLMQTARRGEFFDSLCGNGLLRSPVLNELIKSSEHTSRMDEIFASLAEYYRGNFESLSKKMIAFLEPALILFLGVIIGTIVVSLYIPIFEISSGFGG